MTVSPAALLRSAPRSRPPRVAGPTPTPSSSRGADYRSQVVGALQSRAAWDDEATASGVNVTTVMTLAFETESVHVERFQAIVEQPLKLGAAVGGSMLADPESRRQISELEQNLVDNGLGAFVDLEPFSEGRPGYGLGGLLGMMGVKTKMPSSKVGGSLGTGAPAPPR